MKLEILWLLTLCLAQVSLYSWALCSIQNLSWLEIGLHCVQSSCGPHCYRPKCELIRIYLFRWVNINWLINDHICHSPSLAFTSTSRWPRSSVSCICHIQPPTFPSPRTTLLHQWRRGVATWGWDIVLISVFSLMFLTHLQNIRIIWCFVMPPITPPTPTSNPNRLFGALKNIPEDAIRRY